MDSAKCLSHQKIKETVFTGKGGETGGGVPLGHCAPPPPPGGTREAPTLWCSPKSTKIALNQCCIFLLKKALTLWTSFHAASKCGKGLIMLISFRFNGCHKKKKLMCFSIFSHQPDCATLALKISCVQKSLPLLISHAVLERELYLG